MQGYRTYVIGIIGGVVGIAHLAGYLNDTLFQAIMGLLGSGAIMTMRAAVANKR